MPYTLCLIIIIKSEVWTIIHYLGLGHETMVCVVCLYILMNLWYGQIASWDIRVLLIFAPNLVLCHRHAALWPSQVPYWWLTPSIYVFISIFFRRCVSGRRVFPFCYHKARSPRQGLCTAHAGFSSHEKTKIEKGWPGSPLGPSEGAFELTHGCGCIIGW